MRERDGTNRTRVAGNRDEVEGGVANTLKWPRSGAVGFIGLAKFSRVWESLERDIRHEKTEVTSLLLLAGKFREPSIPPKPKRLFVKGV